MSKLILFSDLTALTAWVYAQTKQFPHDELHNLASQMRNCIVSIRLKADQGNKGVGIVRKKAFEAALSYLYELDVMVSIASELGYIKGDKSFTEYMSMYSACCYKLKNIIGKR